MSGRRVLVVISLLLAQPAVACSLSRGYESFLPERATNGQAAADPQVRIVVDSIQRGRKGDGGTCADIGFLVLKVPAERLGYRFEVVEGDLAVMFPQEFVQPVAPGLIGFTWIDGNTDEQEPIRAVVRVTAMSTTGAQSEPWLLTIEDAGRPPGR